MSRGPMASGRGVATVAVVRERNRSSPTPTDPATAPAVSAGPPTEIETYSLALAALGTAITALALDSHASLTVGLLVLALLPWALLVAAVPVPLSAFVAGTIAPAAAVIVIADGGAPIFFGMFAVMRVVSATGRPGPTIGVLLAAAALPILFDMNKPAGPTDAGVPYFMIGIASAAIWGALLHHQRRLTAELGWTHHRLREAAAAEEQRLRDAAAADERRRIARDVHDVLAHSLTAVVLNVAGARRALANRPELVDEALSRAEQVGRDSLDAVRRTVGLLRPDEAAPRGAAPVPGDADLRTVVAANRLDAGADVSLHESGDLDAVGATAAAALARIVQEALTNAGRHAPGAPVDVRVEVDAERVVVDVTNGPASRPPLDPEGPRQGVGLLGMRERVESLGGTFRAGPASHGGWRVTCAVPLPSRPTAESALPA
jgi:signal transduction histidine kinase